MQNRNTIRLKELVNDRRPARSPIVGIPVMLDSGKLFCVRVRRDLLQSALVHAELAYWDEKSNRLVVNGGKRSCWKLISMERFETQGALSSWARTQRTRVIKKSVPEGERKAAKIELEIGKLLRRRKKLYASRPVNPVCVVPHSYPASEWARESELAWYRGKDTRKALSRVFTGPALKAIGFISRPDWKAVYAEAAKVLGIETISERDQHSRITRLTRGPALQTYVKRPDEYLAHMRKPSRPGKHWSADDRPLNVRMREDRLKFLEEVSAIRAVDSHIANLRELQRAARDIAA